jgi:hypothetical protein
VTKKRRASKRVGGYRTPQQAAVRAAERPARRRPEPEPPRLLGWLSRGTGDSSWPSIPRSIGRGIVVSGSSPALLAISFLFVFGAWVGLVSLGLEGPPGRLVNLAALPPVSTYFDALNGVTIFGYGLAGLAAAGGFLVVRSVYIAVVTGLVVQAFEGGGPPIQGVLRGLRAYPVVVAVNVLSMSMMVAGTIVLPFLGAGLGFLGSILILVAALFLFVFAPAAAIREGRGLQETLRRAARAALLPGSRHVIMSMLYIFLTLPILVAFAPDANRLTVNPGFATWLYALLATFLHTGFLAAFTYRWMAVEDEVPDQPLRRRG